MNRDELIEHVSDLIAHAEEAVLADIREGLAGQEPDIAGRLAAAIQIAARDSPDVSVAVKTFDAAGPNADENLLGADLLMVVRFALDGVETAKGVLVQAKRAALREVAFDPPTANEGSIYSHWLYRGDLHLLPSGQVRIRKPGARLRKQCDDMLKTTPDSFVFVFHEAQVGVVSARAVLSVSTDRAEWAVLGTKRLDDFVAHIIDCFIGDASVTAWDEKSLERMRENVRARNAVLLDVGDLTPLDA